VLNFIKFQGQISRSNFKVKFQGQISRSNFNINILRPNFKVKFQYQYFKAKFQGQILRFHRQISRFQDPISETIFMGQISRSGDFITNL